MATAKHKPGNIVPDSGIAREIGPRGGKTDRHVTVVKDEPFPPTSKSGNSYEYVRKTPSKNK